MVLELFYARYGNDAEGSGLHTAGLRLGWASHVGGTTGRRPRWRARSGWHLLFEPAKCEFANETVFVTSGAAAL